MIWRSHAQGKRFQSAHRSPARADGRRALSGPLAAARRTAELLRKVLGNTKYEDAQQMIDDVRLVGGMVQQARPAELAIGNMVRRILHLIREEAEVRDM